MKILCTYCAAPKRPDLGPLPAVRRYLSARITDLSKETKRRGPAWGFRILSGQYGLLRPEDAVPWYDHLLGLDEVPALVPEVAAALARDRVAAVEYHTADFLRVRQVAPYHEVIARACGLSGIDIDVVLLPGNPD